MRRALACLLLVLLSAPPPARADGAGLAPVAQALAPIRSAPAYNPDYVVGPALTPVKAALRTWVEARLAATPPGPDAAARLAALEKALNSEVTAAGMTCDGSPGDPDRCDSGPNSGRDEDDARGYLGDVHLRPIQGGRFLVVETSVGIHCGYDESAYVYAPGDGGWRLILASEQDRYGKDDYHPQMLLGVSVAPGSTGRPPMVLTWGLSPWCSSNWQGLFTRLWRVSSSTPMPRPLVDRHDILFIGVDEPARGEVSGADAVVEYVAGSIDETRFTRTHVLHFHVSEGGRADRVAPVALGPADFVDEWMTSPWREARRWGGSGVARWHRRLHKILVSGDFDDPPLRRCRADPSLWQVGFAPDEGHVDHFLVRWRRPYDFTLVGVSRRAFAGCDRRVKLGASEQDFVPLSTLRAPVASPRVQD